MDNFQNCEEIAYMNICFSQVSPVKRKEDNKTERSYRPTASDGDCIQLSPDLQ
jgi:hypothetical protein